MALLSSTKTSLFVSESHLLTGVHVTPYLILCAVKSSTLTFSRLENYLSIITLLIFNNNIFLPQSLLELCKQPNLLYLSTSFHFLFWLLSKVLSQNFQFFSPEISILHFLAIILGCSTFWLTLHVPSQTNFVTLVIYGVSVSEQ